MENTLFHCRIRVLYNGNVFTEPLPRNGRGEDHIENAQVPKLTVLLREYMLLVLLRNGHCL
jgi:hypothetical protein